MLPPERAIRTINLFWHAITCLPATAQVALRGRSLRGRGVDRDGKAETGSEPISTRVGEKMAMYSDPVASSFSYPSLPIAHRF
jgi:hypothetical protein